MKTVLIIGTYDTKEDELQFLEDEIRAQGAKALRMDVSVLKEAKMEVHISKHDVASAAGTTIDAIIAYGDENLAFQDMARGASTLVADYYARGEIDALIALGGTMGTDLALDAAMALPMGVPKLIVSTVSFSPLIATERIAPDVQMILWAGGLYGLNSLCQSTLRQAAGAVVGAAKAAKRPDAQTPMIGMTSLGKSALKYMVALKPALEERGYEVAVFHSTGLGGRAFETLAAQGRFACVMDFCMQELVNEQNGSMVSSGADRLTNAGAAGVPQLVAAGASDIIDFLAAYGPPPNLAGRDHHAHNRLIDSVLATNEERVALAKTMADRLGAAKAPVHFFHTQKGVEEWDRDGQDAHNPEGLAAFNKAVKTEIATKIPTTVLDCHINDPEFCEAVLAQFDAWREEGVVK